MPEMYTPRHMALQEINMMSFKGMECTRFQWESLLGKVGLRIENIWAGDGHLQSAIEARLHT